MTLQTILEWFHGIGGRNWPTVSATIEIVTVIEQEQARGANSYLATLTYVYRYPDLQTGEYCRVFGDDEEEDAQAWAASYKGSTVTVHVDPRDPSRSVLREEDL